MDTFKRLKKTFIFLLVLTVLLSLFTAFNSHMNNWLIFRASFFHLLDGTSLYIHYPGEHHDLFKYSPTFALFMAPLAVLPPWLGALLWNLIGALLFIIALVKLPVQDWQRKGVLWVSLPEFIGSTQGFQSNIHLVSLLFLFWVYLEERKPLIASLHILSSFFIKIFGVLGGSLFLYSDLGLKNPRFLVKNLCALLGIGLMTALVPALFIGWESLQFQYLEWLRLLKMDAAHSYGFSLMGVIHGLSGWEFSRLPWQLAGGLSLLTSILYFRDTDQRGRLLGLIALCYFLVLFNHKSESPTFIIAMMAFGLHQSLITEVRVRWGLIIFTLGCVSLMYSDLFRSLRQSHLDLYAVKVWPFILLYPLALTQWQTKKASIKGN